MGVKAEVIGVKVEVRCGLGCWYHSCGAVVAGGEGGLGRWL